MPLGVAVFLVLCGLAGSSLFVHKSRSFGGGFGGVAIVSSAHGAQEFQPSSGAEASFAVTQVGSLSVSASREGGGGGNYITQEERSAFNDDEGIVKDPGGVFSDSTSQSGIVNYAVQPGDTLPSIAADFGVSVDTITSANPTISSGTVAVGKTLKILPVSGVLYISKQGDTLQSIASSFNILGDQIVRANLPLGLGSAPETAAINSGTALIIPAGK